MIRINLLPFRAARKKENIRRQISVYALSLVFLIVVMGYFYFNFNMELAALKADKADKKSELETYTGTSKKIREIKRKIEEIKAKLDVIKQLESNKSGPVHLLDQISIAVPKDKLWLRSLREQKGILTLQGTAMDNDTVALFMTNLEKAKHIISVDLESAKLRTLQQYNLNVTDFVLTCKTYSYKEKAEPETKKKRKRKRS